MWVPTYISNSNEVIYEAFLSHLYTFNIKDSVSMCSGCLHQGSEYTDIPSSTTFFVLCFSSWHFLFCFHCVTQKAVYAVHRHTAKPASLNQNATLIQKYTPLTEWLQLSSQCLHFLLMSNSQILNSIFDSNKNKMSLLHLLFQSKGKCCHTTSINVFRNFK